MRFTIVLMIFSFFIHSANLETSKILTVNKTKKISLKCKTTKNSNLYKWKFKKVPDSEEEISTNQVNNFYNVSMDSTQYSGVYTCTTVLSTKNLESKYFIKIIDPKKVAFKQDCKGNKFGPCFLYPSISPITIEEDRPLSFDCTSVVADTEPLDIFSYSWYRFKHEQFQLKSQISVAELKEQSNWKQIKFPNRVSIVDSKKYRITRTRWDQTGYYKCHVEAKNRENDAIFSNSRIFSVYVKNKDTLITGENFEKKIFKEGSNANLTCAVIQGQIRVNLKWVKMKNKSQLKNITSKKYNRHFVSEKSEFRHLNRRTGISNNQINNQYSTDSDIKLTKNGRESPIETQHSNKNSFRHENFALNKITQLDAGFYVCKSYYYDAGIEASRKIFQVAVVLNQAKSTHITFYAMIPVAIFFISIIGLIICIVRRRIGNKRSSSGSFTSPALNLYLQQSLKNAGTPAKSTNSFAINGRKPLRSGQQHGSFRNVNNKQSVSMDTGSSVAPPSYPINTPPPSLYRSRTESQTSGSMQNKSNYLYHPCSVANTSTDSSSSIVTGGSNSLVNPPPSNSSSPPHISPLFYSPNMTLYLNPAPPHPTPQFHSTFDQISFADHSPSSVANVV